MPRLSGHAPRELRTIRAWLFDLDGVLTPTAEVHMRAWERLFAPFLAERAAEPYSEADYFAHIDGKPRYDGVASLLASRGIDLPYGTPDDADTAETVCGLGNRKNAMFTAELETNGVDPYPGSANFLAAVLANGCRVAVVSSSQNAAAVLAAAGLAASFAVVIDGRFAAEAHLPGKPAPDTFVRAASLLGVPAADCAVVEDAESGISAGAAGDFGLVLGVDRGVGAEALIERGADRVVDDLAELIDEISTDQSEAR